MKESLGRMHVAVIPSKQKNGKTYRATLIRQSYRDPNDKTKIRKKTLANISKLPKEGIVLLQNFLKGKVLVEADSAFPAKVVDTKSYGHIHAVMLAMKRLGIADLIASRPSSERQLICAMIVSRIIRPDSKLSTCGWWQLNRMTLAEHYPAITNATSDHLYRAMDTLLKRQPAIQKKLAKRLLQEGGSVLYDLSSSYFEGSKCALAKHGYSRDNQPQKAQVNYGLLCDPRGRPVAITAHEGNVHDASTLIAEITRLKEQFKLTKVLIIGDRGMITQTKIDHLKQLGNVDWVSALRKSSITKLISDKQINLDDQAHICEFDHPDYLDERLIACYNEPLATKSSHDREQLLLLTEESLTELKTRLEKKDRPSSEGEIGLALGQVINRYKMKKYFITEISNGTFSFTRKEERIALDKAKDGIYVIRTSLHESQKSSDDCVRAYKSLAKVERAFRVLKSDLRIRPIHHWKSDRVKSHLFLCMLTYYVEWHMREAWKEFTFADTELDNNIQCSDPVHPTPQSESSLKKQQGKALPDDTPVCSYQTLLDGLSGVAKVTYEINYTGSSKHITSSATQRRFAVTAPFNQREQELIDRLNKITP